MALSYSISELTRTKGEMESFLADEDADAMKVIPTFCCPFILFLKKTMVESTTVAFLNMCRSQEGIQDSREKFEDKWSAKGSSSL